MTDLDALRRHLESMASTVVLASTDPGLPEELAAFLRAMPLGTLRLTPQAGGISLAGQVLTVTGATSDAWPVSGLGPAGDRLVRLTRATITLTGPSAPGGAAAVSGTARGTLDLGSPVEVTLSSTRTPVAGGASLPAWRLGLGAAARLGLHELLTLGFGRDDRLEGLPVQPPVFQDVARVGPDDFALTFYPGTQYPSMLVLAVEVPGAQWAAIPSVLEFDGVKVQAAVGPDQYQIALIGRIAVGGVAVRIAVMPAAHSRWTALVQPADAEAFPGLAALAGWARAGESAAADLAALAGAGTGVSGLGVDGFDAAIRKVTVAFDAAALDLQSVEVVSVLTLGALRLDVVLVLPALTVEGRLHRGEPVGAAALLASLGLPSGGVPADLAIVEAAFRARPRAGLYSADLTLGNVWQVGPVALQQLSLALGYDTEAGLSGSVEAALDFGESISVRLRAEYRGQAQGWRFSGQTAPGDSVEIGDLIAALAEEFGITAVPALLRSLALTGVSASLETGTGAFAFGCTGRFEVLGAPAELTVHVALTPGAARPAPEDGDEDAAHSATTTGTAGYTATYRGTLTFGGLSFSVAVTVDDTTDLSIEGHWKAAAGRPPLGLAGLAEVLGLPVPQLPAGLDLGLAAAQLTYDGAGRRLIVAAESTAYGKAVFLALPDPGRPAAAANDKAGGTAGEGAGRDAPTVYLAALAVGHRIDLSELPLVGTALGPEDTCAVEDLQVLLSSTPITPSLADAVRGLVPRGYARFPAQGSGSGAAAAGPALALSAVLRFGEQTIPISLGAAPAPGRDAAPAASSASVGASDGPGGVVAAPATASDGTVWFTVQKAFGPVTLARIGARYDDGVLRFLLDGSLEAAGLSLALEGASVGTPLSDFVPQFALRGLGLGYTNPPLAVLGGFTSVPPADGASFRYDGGAVVSLPSWGATAFGSYTEVDGQPSMFLFLSAAGAFGGPPAFSVTALAAGFGYNSAIRIPGPAEAADFPLVAALADPTRLAGPEATPARALAAFNDGPRPWLSPAAGQTWLAAGVRFSTYGQLDTTALLAVEFGNALTVLLLGLSTARFPATGSDRPYAQLQLSLRSVFRPGEGVFELAAALTGDSYLLDPACVLTGGFAFAAWFGNHPRAGDFAVTVGGYHPAFHPPEHYPVVPRVGFSWSLDDAVRISGTSYFALTPAAIMAGGTLDVRYHDGSLTAWFTARADLLIKWSPFSFRAGFAVSVGVEYTTNLLFTTKTLHLEAGADLELWGPPTGGTVTVRLWVVTFTVAFGAPPRTVAEAVDWAGFQAMLPGPEGSTTFAAAAGLAAPQSVPAASGPAQDAAPWPVRADGFTVTLRFAVPTTRVFLGTAAKDAAVTGPAVDIRPMRRFGMTVDLRVVLTRASAGRTVEVDLAQTGWRAEAVTSNVPKALWGDEAGSALDPGSDPLAPDRLTGLTLAAPSAIPGWSAGPIDARSTLSVAQVGSGAALPLSAGAAPAGPVAAHGGAVAAIVAQISGSGATAARDALFDQLDQLGAAPGANGPVRGFAAAAAALFTDEPMLTGAAP